MKRTPLKRGSSVLKRSAPMRRSAMKRSRPKRQPIERRDDAFKAFVRGLPCCAPIVTCLSRPCDPHHRHGDGKGIKTHDNTCVPLCREHHDQAEGKWGVFKAFTKASTREWHDAESARVRALYESQQPGAHAFAGEVF